MHSWRQWTAVSDGTTGEAMTADESAQWMIEAVCVEAERQGQPLDTDDREMLTANVTSLGPADRPLMAMLNNVVVVLARSAMDRSKRAGAPTTKARRGLSIPSDWYRHYMATYNANHPWVISAIMQNAMMANPLAGERKPWKSK